MEHFCEDIEGWFNFHSIYQEAVDRAHDGAVLVEVGAFKGKSTAFMAVEIINSGKQIDFYVVDTWKGSPEHQNRPDVRDGQLWSEFLANLAPVSNVIRPLIESSVEAAKTFEDKSLDFIFIDASHRYEDVLADLRAWYPKVKCDGTLAGHDLPWPSVKSAVDAFCDEAGLSYQPVAPSSWKLNL